MLPVFSRLARNNEGTQFLEWAKDQPGFDASVPYQPGTFTLAAFNKQKVICYIPIQRPFVLETVSINPGASDLEIAAAMRTIVQHLVGTSQLEKASEIMFLATDDGTAELAENTIFEKLPFTVYRVKIRDLEPQE